jgi:hypothetical protein
MSNPSLHSTAASEWSANPGGSQDPSAGRDSGAGPGSGCTDRYGDPVATTLASRPLALGHRRLVPTPVFDSYWRFARRRQDIYEARVAGASGPWTQDAVLGTYRFTNAFRAADRVSQALLRVQREGAPEPHEMLFRTLLFRFFNRPATFALLTDRLGEVPSWRMFDAALYEQLLGAELGRGRRLYSPAYIIPAPPFGLPRKHQNHLALLEHVMSSGAADDLVATTTLRGLFYRLVRLPGLGRFLAFQLAIDMGYAAPWALAESEFVVAGPGAVSGIRKCFTDAGGLAPEEVIRVVAEAQQEEFVARGLPPVTLFGRALQLIDCQNLFCEIDKYARVAHPSVSGVGDRQRIKQRFAAAGPVPAPIFPAHWGLAVPRETPSTSVG